MKDFPALLILTDREHLVAHRLNGSGDLERIDSLEPMEGNEKIADLVTDQAESFPTDDPGTPGYEGMPLRDELEIRSLRQVAGKIEEILEREAPVSWGFAAGRELNEAILDQLPDEICETLTLNLHVDLTHAPCAEVRERFSGALQRSAGTP